MPYRLGELFCGPGGIAWGALHADIGNPEYTIVHQWANDYDASTCDTYRYNICPYPHRLFTTRISENLT